MNKITAPFYLQRNFRGMSIQEKIVGIIYYPVILIMWYGYYMWVKPVDSFWEAKRK